MRRLMLALRIYAGGNWSWVTAWRHAGDRTLTQLEAPYRPVERADGFKYVEITPRPE